MDFVLWGLIYQPNDKKLLLLRARAEAAKSPTLAIPTLKILQEKYANDIDVVIYLANAYLDANQPKKAVDFLKTQLAAYDGTSDEQRIHIHLAIAMHKNGNKEEAQEILRTLQQSNPDDPAPLLARIQILKDEQLWTQLRQIAVDWSQNRPEDTHTLNTIAGNLAANENSMAREIAEDLLREILNRNPDSLVANNTLAMLLQTQGDSTEAAIFYRRTLTLQPDNVIAINNLAWILCDEQGKYKEALELAQRGLRFAPDYVDLIDTRGVLYDKLGQYDKAIQDFNKCLELYPDNTPARTTSYLHLAKVVTKLGQKDEAVKSFKRALELNSEIGGLSEAEHPDAENLVENLSRGI